MTIKVEKWISYRESEGMKESFGGMGGWFDNGMRWKDYIESIKPEYREYPEAIRASVIENRIKATGSQHQSEMELVPVFNDDTVATFSYRACGDLMAAIWSEEEDKDYNYMSFYC